MLLKKWHIPNTDSISTNQVEIESVFSIEVCAVIGWVGCLQNGHQLLLRGSVCGPSSSSLSSSSAVPSQPLLPGFVLGTIPASANSSYSGSLSISNSSSISSLCSSLLLLLLKKPKIPISCT